MQDKICAIIVTWNTGRELEQGMISLAPQVGRVVIVDNGSRPETLKILNQLQVKFHNVICLQNGRNLGIAAALNRGVLYALEQGYEWVLTLDDDSCLESTMVRRMVHAYNSLCDEEMARVMIVSPNYTTLKGLVFSEESPLIVEATITSGQMIRIKAFSMFGMYNENLFIECVDNEFCFRMAKFRFKTLVVPDAVLYQRIGGAPKLYQILWKKFVVPNHNFVRYYYLYRNSIYIYQHFFMIVPAWTLRNIFSNLIVFAKIIFFEKEKIKKIIAITRGIWDAFRGKYGQCPVHYWG